MMSALSRFESPIVSARPSVDQGRSLGLLSAWLVDSSLRVSANLLIGSRGMKKQPSPYESARLTTNDVALNQYNYPAASFSVVLNSTTGANAVFGVFQIRFKGTLSAIRFAATPVAGSTIQPLVYDAPTNTTTTTVTIPAAPTSVFALHFDNPSADFRDLEVIEPGMSWSEKYSRHFTESIAHAACLRPYFDWASYDGVQTMGTTLETTWLNTAHPSRQNYSAEYWAGVCNDHKKDFWMDSVASMAGSEQIRLVDLILNKLDAKQSLYFMLDAPYTSRFVYGKALRQDASIYTFNTPTDTYLFSTFTNDGTTCTLQLNVLSPTVALGAPFLIHSSTRAMNGQFTITAINGTTVSWATPSPSYPTSWSPTANTDFVRFDLNHRYTFKPSFDRNEDTNTGGYTEDHEMKLMYMIDLLRQVHQHIAITRPQDLKRFHPVLDVPSFNQTITPYVDYCLRNFGDAKWLEFSTRAAVVPSGTNTTDLTALHDAHVAALPGLLAVVDTFASQARAWCVKLHLRQAVLDIGTRTDNAMGVAFSNYIRSAKYTEFVEQMLTEVSARVSGVCFFMRYGASNNYESRTSATVRDYNYFAASSAPTDSPRNAGTKAAKLKPDMTRKQVIAVSAGLIEFKNVMGLFYIGTQTGASSGKQYKRAVASSIVSTMKVCLDNTTIGNHLLRLWAACEAETLVVTVTTPMGQSVRFQLSPANAAEYPPEAVALDDPHVLLNPGLTTLTLSIPARTSRLMLGGIEASKV